ncbi:quinol monooxygenase YgiN [Aliiruegeria haliotis]|uniref:Quinol monooxygenase YgiN n=1 Tax=Aliiruegeria haliotis TaxID=1280846 RepID=A0A2T0RYL6_9RHOB|nr:antibiotic biosynthesis monooxygenase [Aliiruegeria haliotis]PRY26286.1 quinol monooxygenase YgiN [Aliiruegeria haliotis]
MGVSLSGHIDIPADRLQEIAAALPEHIRLTRAEPGCVHFDVTPDADVPGRYIVSERFASRAAFEAHQARTRASDWGRISAGIPRHFEISEDGE